MKIQPHSFSLLDTENLSAGTHYYHSANGQKTGVRPFLSLTGWIEDADGTITLTVEGSNDGSTWVQLYGYDTQNATDVNSISVTSSLSAFAWDFDNLNYIYYRVKVVNTGATNTIKINGRAR